MFGNKEKEICGHKFEIVKKGLSEEQVADFINQLMEKLNSVEAARAQSEQLISPTNLAQKVLRETNEQIANIQQDMVASLQTEADRIATEVEEKAQRTREEAEAEIKAALEKLVEEVTVVAWEKITAITTEAREKMTAIGDESREKVQAIEATARQDVQETVARNNSNADRKLKAAAKKVYESLLAELETLTSGLQDMVSQASQGGEVPSASRSTEESSPHSAEPDAGETTPGDESQTAARAEATAEEGQESGATAAEANAPPPAGEEPLSPAQVEVNVQPPVDIAQLALLRRALEETPEVSIVSTGGSVDHGAYIVIEVRDGILLPELLAKVPVVEKAVEESGPRKSSGKKVTISLKGSSG